MRKYKTGSTRSNADGKIDYLGFTNPLTEHSYGKYMLKHRVQEDGELRDADNWWKGIDQNATIQSLIRHTKDLEAIHAGYYVYKVRDKEEEKTVVSIKPLKAFKYCEVTKEECLNAIRFNCGSYLLEELKK